MPRFAGFQLDRAKLDEYRGAGVTLPSIGVLGGRAEGEVEATLEAAAATS